jgi:hypothetical protein
MALVPAVTPKLDDFLVEYEQDDNVWWRLACGHHMNLFEEAVSRMLSAERRLASADPPDRAGSLG